MQSSFDEGKKVAKSSRENIEKDIKNIEARIKKMKINANFDGVVFNILVHEDSIVNCSQAIAQISPKNDAIEVETTMSKANCGLIEIGNTVTIKLHAFPYQIYGTIKGTVKSLSPVSANEVTKENGINVRIKLDTQTIETEKHHIYLRPLMSAEITINVNTTSIAKYVLMYMTRR